MLCEWIGSIIQTNSGDQRKDYKILTGQISMPNHSLSNWKTISVFCIKLITILIDRSLWRIPSLSLQCPYAGI